MDVDAFLAGENKDSSKSFDFDKELTDYFKQQDVKVAPDMFKSIPAGIAHGISGAIGWPEDVANLMKKGTDYLGITDPEFHSPIAGRGPTSGDVMSGIQSLTGPMYEAQTTPGKLSESAVSFATGAPFGPRAMVGAAAGGIASEAAGEATEGTAYEPWARLAGGIAAPYALSKYFPGAQAVPRAPRGPDSPPDAAGLREELGPTPDRGYPGVPATRGTSQPEPYVLHPEVLPPRPGARPEPIDVEGEFYTTPPNVKGMKESVGSTSEAYPSTPMRYQDPFTHWPVTEHPMPGEPPRATGEPMAGRGPAPMLALPGARPVPQEPGPMPVPRAQENQPRTTTVGKQPTDVKVYGDFEVGTDAMMEKVIAGQKMTAPMGKITELYLKPEKVLKPNPVPGQGASKITTTEQVPYAKFADGREAPLSQLKKVNAPQTSPDKVKEMLNKGKVVGEKGLNFKNTDAVIDAIKNVRKITGAHNLTYDIIKKHIPNIPDAVLDKAGQKMAAEKSGNWAWGKGMIRVKPPSERSSSTISRNFNNIISTLRETEFSLNSKYAYLRNLNKVIGSTEQHTIKQGKLREELNRMIKQGKLKVYPEGEPDAPINSVTEDLLAESIFEDSPDYVMEFLDKKKK